MISNFKIQNKDSKIYVIKSKNFGQAYSTLSMLDFSSDDPDLIAEQLTEGMENVVTGMITKSIRDANINEVDIKEGEYIGFTDKTMHVSTPTKLETYKGLLEKISAQDKEFLINIYADSVTDEEKEEINNLLQEKYPSLEVYELEGNQEVYDIITILE